MFELLVLFLLCLFLVYKFLKNERDYWKNRNVPYAEGRLLVGNLGPSLLMISSLSQIFDDIYKRFDGYKYIGVLSFRKPAILIRDTNLIKDVLVKDFNNFHDNLIEVDDKADPLLAKNPFFLKGEMWKKVRAQISPQFTAGKIKKMFPLIAEVSKKMQGYLHNQVDSGQNLCLNAKEFASKFTADNIASCAFGLDGRSFDDQDAEFKKMGTKMMGGSVFGMLYFLIVTLVPELSKIKAPRFLSPEISDWFRTIVVNTIKNREEHQIKRDDFLDIVKEMKNKTTSFEFTHDHMVAHCLSFFLDGFETSAVVLQYALYELGANPDMQAKLREECNGVLTKYDGALTYDGLQEMPFLEMVFLETLRKYPPLTVMFRNCTEATKLPPPIEGGSEIVIEKGVGIIIPVTAIHNNPQYYPNPEKFDPYRFSEEEKNSRPKQLFLGFGDGPRICLGQRFGTTQVKAGIASIVSQFEVRVNEKTKVPLELDPKEFIQAPKGGIWLDFYERKGDA